MLARPLAAALLLWLACSSPSVLERRVPRWDDVEAVEEIASKLPKDDARLIRKYAELMGPTSRATDIALLDSSNFAARMELMTVREALVVAGHIGFED